MKAFIGYILLMIIKRHAFPSDIVFYEGIIIAFFYYTILYYKYFSIEKCLIGFLICLNFWALIPTIIDRSVSSKDPRNLQHLLSIRSLDVRLNLLTFLH